MPLYDLGPRTRRIYDSLRDRIRSGELAPGVQLPPHKQLATEFGVAPMTIRQVLARLDDDGLISRQVGRGTFVRASRAPHVLILARSPLRESLTEPVEHLSASVTATGEPDTALSLLASQPEIALVFAEVGPGAANLDLVRTVRRRWPQVALAVVLASPAELEPLADTPESPVLVLMTPVHAAQVEEIVRLALHHAPANDQDRTTAGLETLKFQALLLDSVDQAIIATAPRGEILYWNKGAERLYGWRADEVMGKNAGEVIVSPDQYAMGLQIMDRLRHGETWTGEFTVVRRDGSTFPVLVTDSPIRDANGRLLGIIGVAIDLSERKQAERDRLALARLETALAAYEAGGA
jgi:PAS domain S-box-containing protein